VKLARRVPLLTIRQSRGIFDVRGPAGYAAGAIVKNGPSARWTWDGHILVVENDRHGVFPLFWHASPGTIAVSPSIDALLDSGVPATLDDTALAVFLRAGYFAGDDTPFASIRALPPAARLTWDTPRANPSVATTTPSPATPSGAATTQACPPSRRSRATASGRSGTTTSPGTTRCASP
jgi:hypothetical protein